MRRREFLAAGLAAPLVWGSRGVAQAPAPIYISDMHFHSFFGESKYHSRPVAKTMADGQATLVSWSLAGDMLWIDKSLKQISEPKPGEALGWLRRELGRIREHVAEQRLKLALRAEDIDLAMKGEPHIVLSVEGAAFIENDPARVQIAYDLGVRHIQLIHYIRSPLGDLQTTAPVHNGLTDVGKAVIAECNRLGILVDLAHCTPATLDAALAVSKVPPIWSHGSVTQGPPPDWRMITWKARQLSVARARAIAKAGGVVGLWALDVDVGRTVEAYGARLLELADLIGDEHVAFGTDINGLFDRAVMHSYADVRQVVEGWQRKGIVDRRIRRIAGENYGRVLKKAMQARIT
jgi:membrane dipeptidase